MKFLVVLFLFYLSIPLHAQQNIYRVPEFEWANLPTWWGQWGNRIFGIGSKYHRTCFLDVGGTLEVISEKSGMAWVRYFHEADQTRYDNRCQDGAKFYISLERLQLFEEKEKELGPMRNQVQKILGNLGKENPIDYSIGPYSHNDNLIVHGIVDIIARAIKVSHLFPDYHTVEFCGFTRIRLKGTMLVMGFTEDNKKALVYYTDSTHLSENDWAMPCTTNDARHLLLDITQLDEWITTDQLSVFRN